MNISSLARHALVVTTCAGLLAGCSSNSAASLPQTGISWEGMGAAHMTKAVMFNGLWLTASHPAQLHGPSVLPDKKHHKKREPDQYISDVGTDTAFEFDYPKSDSSIGSINGFIVPQGECTKNGKRTFWVTDSGAADIQEFNVGGSSPIKTLSESVGIAVACAVDPATGDLATTILSNGDVIVFANAVEPGATYSTGLFQAYFAGYDNKGDLFVDGFVSQNVVGLIELPKGGSSFQNISVSNTIEFPGNVQWDGKYITVNDQNSHEIYRYSLSGSAATLKDTVELSGSKDCDGTWIAKNVVYCPDAGAANVKVYKYPAGGNPIASLTGGRIPLGAVRVSK